MPKFASILVHFVRFNSHTFYLVLVNIQIEFGCQCRHLDLLGNTILSLDEKSHSKVTHCKCLQYFSITYRIEKKQQIKYVNKMSTESNLLNKDTTMDDASPGNTDADDETHAKNNEQFLAKASMTESYSEILNSPTADVSDLPVESNAPIVIPRRRPSSLSRHHSNQCKCLL